MAKNKQNAEEQSETVNKNVISSEENNKKMESETTAKLDNDPINEDVEIVNPKEIVDEATIEQNMEENQDKTTVESSLDDEMTKLNLQLEEMKDKYIRLSAEFDNYRKRTLKEKMELTKSAGESILLNIIPVVDNFERALKSVREAKEIEPVKEGIELIYTTFADFLKQQGVNEIAANNQDFNTDEHEALTKIPAPMPELKGKVIDVIEKGYKLYDKVIRFAKVVVAE
jgi:molecular chaperone GrpE